MNPTNEDDCQHVARWMIESTAAVVFTGAGVSTESGIPDFRSPTGIWAKYRPVYYQEFLEDPQSRHEYWQQKAEGHAEFSRAEPNVAHRIIAEWQIAGRLRGVITQNIDGLHQLAGSQQVLELHGNVREVQCLDCDARFPADPLVAEFLQTNRVPACPECGQGRLKHATISFGQLLPPDVLQQAATWSRKADLMLAIGSSLVVTPAADLPALTKRHGGKLVIINRDPTPLDAAADVVLRQSIGEVLQAIDQHIAGLA